MSDQKYEEEQPQQQQQQQQQQVSHLDVNAAAAAGGAHGDDVSSPYGGSPEKQKKSLELANEDIDDAFNYMGIDKKKLFETIERRSTKMLAELGGREVLAGQMKVDCTQGIANTAAEEQMRQHEFGVNVLNKKEPATFWEFFAEACEDKVVIILAVAAVVSIVLGMTVPNPHSGHVELEVGWIEGTAIIISIAVVTLTGSINNYQKAKQFEEMEKEQSVKDLDVTRGGKKVSIKSDHLVVGDLLHLVYGMELSADGLIIQAADLKMSEAAITGESDLIEKDPKDEPFILSGTSVDEGTGLMLCIGVGMNSFQGHLKKSLDEESGGTPLQEHLSELADLIGYFGFALAAILIIALMIKEGILISTQGKEANGTNFLNFFLIAVTLIVVAIPEGLPLAVTIALAFSMKAMMADECMVRVLASCETMGAATAICSDKTGTLTTNIMTCVQGCIGGEEFVIDGYKCAKRHPTVHVADRDPKKFELRSHQNALSLFQFSVAINTTADQEMRDNELQWRGNKTEIGMLKLLELMQIDYSKIRAQYPHSATDRIKQFPFNSTKKRMTTVVREEESNTLTVHVKGASEDILKQCDFYMDSQGGVSHMTGETFTLFNDIIEDMAKQGNRTIGVACVQDLPAPDGPISKEEPDHRYVFLGVVGIQDPIRQEVPHAIERAHAAGLTVRMCTGDNIVTAISISKKCHIFEENGWDIAMQGIDFRKMALTDKESLRKLLPRIKVLARSSPQDKYILVDMLRGKIPEEERMKREKEEAERKKKCEAKGEKFVPLPELVIDLENDPDYCSPFSGEVVGVTGDGTNDAPALKKADVGFAMKSGTDIAKGASDMVLLDDNFATIVTAIKWGRAVNDNIKKFLQFQLTINVAGVLLTLIASLISETSKEPFTPVQLLWLNLIMDTLAALSLATELPEEASLTREPVFKDAPLITRRMWCFIAVHGTWQFILILVLLLVGHLWFHTVEKEGLCDKDYGVVWVNGTTTDHGTRKYCDLECTRDGGHLVGGNGTDRYICQQGTRHSTFMFNVFIWTQVFNVINSRKIHGEMNPFEGLWDRSKQLLIIFALIAGLQTIAVEFFGRFMSTNGLNGTQWGASIGISAITMIIGIIQRLIPVEDETPEKIVEKRKKVQELRDAVKAHEVQLAHAHIEDGVFKMEEQQQQQQQQQQNPELEQMEQEQQQETQNAPYAS